MDYYMEIIILPDPEFPMPTLMNALFYKLHRALVHLESSNVGVSFPKVDEKRPTLGDMMRLHGSQHVLQNLQGMGWLNGMRDYIELADIEPVPGNVKHCRVKRVQVKSSAERLRKRYQKRHKDVTEKDAESLITDSVEQRLELPYLQIKSESTGQRFRLFLKHEPPRLEPREGGFNRYGLSNTATIPWF